MMTAETPEELDLLLEYTRRTRGFDFTGYKRPSLIRRVRRRMDTVRMQNYGEYIDYLEVHPDEFEQLFNTILINVTSFFRDQAAWDYLAAECIPRILAAKGPEDQIRIWSAGCASGEEPYSIAIAFAEAMGKDAFRKRVKIYASDIDEEALTQARLASYTGKQLESVNPELMEKYFDRIGSKFAFRPDLRRSVIFGRHDLMRDAPISRLDLLSCRNTLMYFNAEAQGEILRRIHFAICDKGYLFLGKAEMMLTQGHLFAPVDLRHRIFEKVPQALPERLRPAQVDSALQMARHARLRDRAFDSSASAQIVVDINGILVLINERARSLLNLGIANIGKSFHDLQVSYQPFELRSLIERAYAERRLIKVSNLSRFNPDGEVQHLELRVTPLNDDNDVAIGVCVSLDDVTRYHKMQEELQRANQEIETAYEELQSTNEELETTNEELQSTNEELETTNEELQSTNEEMETMNEELQSTNEELQTLNDELRQRTDELNTTNKFLESILASLRSAVVVVDRKSNVVSWNAHAGELWGLRPDDVEGMPLLTLDTGLPVEQLTSAVRDCLVGNQNYLELVVKAVNRRGRNFSCHITFTPLIDGANDRTGVLLLMSEEIDGKDGNLERNKG
jgi:two-component system, chemotaxis family, CheB/CheR fusion protein